MRVLQRSFAVNRIHGAADASSAARYPGRGRPGGHAGVLLRIPNPHLNNCDPSGHQTPEVL